jgi:hypothetical protein
LIPKSFRIEFLARRREFITLLGGAALTGESRMPYWLLALLILLIDGSGRAVAQPWPSKPIRAIVPFAAGSATDVVPRAVLEPLSAQLGQPIVIENRGGAGTTIGAAIVAKAEPDGYTILATSSAHLGADRLSECTVRHGNRFCGSGLARKQPECVGGLAIEGLQDGA